MAVFQTQLGSAGDVDEESTAAEASVVAGGDTGRSPAASDPVRVAPITVENRQTKPPTMIQNPSRFVAEETDRTADPTAPSVRPIDPSHAAASRPMRNELREPQKEAVQVAANEPAPADDYLNALRSRSDVPPAEVNDSRDVEGDVPASSDQINPAQRVVADNSVVENPPVELATDTPPSSEAAPAVESYPPKSLEEGFDPAISIGADRTWQSTCRAGRQPSGSAAHRK